MRNKLIKKAIVFILALIVVSSLGTLTIFAQTGEQITAVSYNAYEAIVLGESVNITADVTISDGGETRQEKRAIKYTNFSVKEMNKVFNNFYAEGYVEGFDEVIKQTIIVVPDNIEYLINFGANTTDVEYIAPGEGALGLELDHTGVNAQNEPYYAAVKRLFPDIRNKTAVKQFGVNADADGDWGYFGDGQIAMKKTTAAQRNLFENIMFPKRGTVDIDTRLTLAAGNYDTYIGTYSYWFARPVGIEFDDTVLAKDYQVKPSKELFVDKNRPLTEGSHKIEITGASMYNEAMASFICVTKADVTDYPKYSAPQSKDIILLEEESLTISGLTVGAKLQIFNYDNSCLLKEYTVGEGETEINFTFTPDEMEGVSRIGLCQTNAGGASDVKIVQRTDISVFDVSYDSGYVGEDLEVTLTATSASPITKLLLKDESGNEIINKTVALPAVSFTDKIFIQNNGSFVLELTSAVGGKSVKEFTISNIDKVNPELSLAFNLNSVKNSAKDKVSLGLNVSSVSGISELAYSKDGKNTALNSGAKSVDFTSSGNYTVYMENELGKSSAKKVRVALKQEDILTVSATVSPVNKYQSVSLKGKNGYTVGAVTVYGTTNAGSEKMIVNGSGDDTKFNVYENGTYFVEIVTGDGTREIFVMNFDGAKAGGCGAVVLPSGGGILTGLLLATGAALVLLATKKKEKKNAY